MADSVKDLVVRLSFEHGDTKSQITAIKNEIKLLDSGFAAAAAQAGGFSDKLNQSGAKADLLKQKIALQEQAIAKYGQAIEQANQKIKAAQDRQTSYAAKIEAAKAKNTELTAAIKQQQQALSQAAASGKEGTEEYAEMEAELQRLKDELTKNNEQIKQWEQGIKRADTTIANADKNIQKMTTAQNESKTAMANMQGELDKLNSKVEQHKQKLESAAKSLEAYSEKTTKTGEAQQKVGKTLTKVSAGIVSAGVAAAGAAISWEDSFAGVQKTVSGTEEQLAEIETSLVDMSQVKPVDSSTLAEIAANAGQLGIATENVVGFTEVMADLTATTNLTAEDGASAFAKFANITGMSQTNFSNLASTVVELGNNMATTESDIVAMATNLASAGSQVGMTESEIMGMAAALSSLGLEAQAGGTAFSKLFVNMQVAAETGSESLKDYAEVAGMTADEFATMFSQDAAGAVTQFIQGLSSGSESAIVMLDEMGISETRFRDALLRSANASELFSSSIDMANSAWSENTALANEAQTKYNTTASKLTMVGNKAKAAAASFGSALLPVIQDGIDWISKIIDKFNALDEGTQKQILTFAAYAAAVGPAISVIGKLNSTVGSVTGVMGKLTSAAAGAGGGLSSLLSAVGGLLGPVGIAALAAAAGVAIYKFADWASGAKAAREATEQLQETAEEWASSQATTMYDTGTSDPLARFGMDKESFTKAGARGGSWIDSLVAEWTDGKKETSETVQSFVDSFAEDSDKVRDAIDQRSQLLGNLGTLSPETQAQMDADLAQLDEWDKEIEQLLKKKQNGKLTEDDQARLDEVVKLRAELQLEYSGTTGNGYEGIIQGLQSEISRTLASGGEVGMDVYGDALNALAEGRQAYNEALDQSYDTQYAEVMAIEDEAQRTEALAALNEQYNQQRLEGEREYQEAVKQVATETMKTGLESGGFQEQIDLIDQISAALASGDTVSVANLTEGLDEGTLTSLLSVVEQLKSSGTTDSEFAQMGVDADDLLSKIQQIRDLASGTEGMEGLASMFGEALPEEVQRVMVGLDMTQAEEDWAAFAEGKDTFETKGSITLNPLDETTIAKWEAENSGIEVTGPAAKMSVGLGANWKTDLQTALDNGMLELYGADGKKIEITPEVLEQIDDDDLVMNCEDGKVRVVIVPEVGTSEAVDLSTANMESNALEGTVVSFMGESTQDSVNKINNMTQALAEQQAQIDALNASGEVYTETGVSMNELQTNQDASVVALTQSLQSLSGEDLTNIGTQIATIMAALSSGTLDAETTAQYTEQLQQLLGVIGAADQYLGTGNMVSAGIAEGMNQYGWEGDASTLAGSIQGAINGALGVASPATSMVPTGQYVSAGIAQGMSQYGFASVAGTIASNLTSAFSSLEDDGDGIGKNFGKGLQSGLESEMKKLVSKAKTYAKQISQTIKDAWQIHSPSKVAEGLTTMFGRGLEEGMNDWPTVSEALLNSDIRRVYGAYAAAGASVDNSTATYNQQRSLAVTVDGMTVRSDQDVQQIARELNALDRRYLRGRGKW